MVNEYPLGVVQLGLGAFIYKIRNKINDKSYYGSSINTTHRWRGHLSNLQNSKHHSRHLQNAVHLYGLEQFVFCLVEPVEPHLLLEKEQIWLDKTKSYLSNLGYNISPTAGSCLGMIMSEETKIKISEANATKLDRASVSLIKGMLSKGIRAKDIAKEFRVSACHVQQIKFNRCWKHVFVDGEYHYGVAGERNPSAKLTRDDVIEMRSMFGKIKVKDIANFFNVSIPTVEAVKYGKTWKDVK